MPELRQYHVFISHAWRYSEDYERLEKMLKGAPNFAFHNYSVPRHDPLIDPNTPVGKQKLQRLLDEQIRPVGVVLVISGMYVHYKEWIQYELNSAWRMGKPIVGIVPWGQERTPQEVQNVVRAMIGWNTASIVDAIRKYSLQRNALPCSGGIARSS